MTHYEHLEQLAHSCGVRINLSILREEDALDGLYVALRDGGCLILINRHRTQAERTAALAEELGHYFKSVGDLRDLRDIAAAKSENMGRAWSYEQLLPFDSLDHQLKNGHGSPWELADAVNLPQGFVQEAISFYSHRPRSPLRKRAEPLEPEKPSRPRARDIAPLAYERMTKRIGRRPSKRRWSEISYAFRTELVFTRDNLAAARSLREPNTATMSALIRDLYREIFEQA